MTTRLRIVHITDLHVGERFVDYHAPQIRGFSAVDISVMQALAAAAPSARPVAPSDACCCVVSGDLTAYGNRQEFTHAETYLSGVIIHGGVSTGLEYGVDDAWDGVLGNHDIWGGRLSLVAWYAAVPKREAAQQAMRLTEGVRRGRFGAGRQEYIDVGCLRVRFYMLDSTLPGWRNVFARGRVSLTDLESLKACVAEDEVVDERAKTDSGIKEVLRIAVLHHPLSRRWSGALFEQMVLENGPDVLSVLNAAKFGLVLCGHEHEFAYDGLGPGLQELNAGTSLQAVRGGSTNTFAVIEIVDPVHSRPKRADHVYLQVTKYVSHYQSGCSSTFSPNPAPRTLVRVHTLR